jgi:polyhydroxyalkanoate synthesis regulator phasin
LVGTKATVKERLANLSGTLQAKGKLAGEKAHQAAEESREALEGILSNLRSLVGK